MSNDSDFETDFMDDAADAMNHIYKQLTELYEFRDLFFENHPIEMANDKNGLVEFRQSKLVDKLEYIDVDTVIPIDYRAKFYYMKGRAYNISPKYDPRASLNLSKAVKLNPHMVDAWNELGECYWKNLNIKEAKANFEGALKHGRNALSLRCLSIIIRQESSASRKRSEATAAILKSVELAKEAVALDTKDGVSWSVLGNAYLCQFFTVSQDPATLKLCMSAYKQANLDPIAKGQPDLHYNEGVALKYSELYGEAIEKYTHACRLDPPWEPPEKERAILIKYTQAADALIKTKGKLKIKKITNMVQSIDEKMLGIYSPGNLNSFGDRREVALEYVQINALQEGTNEGKVILGKVVGSIHNENSVPFTFAIIDKSMECILVTVYNWADGRGAIICDSVAIPEPHVSVQKYDSTMTKYNFKSIRVNNPMLLQLNGKRVGRNQYACTRVTSTYESH